MKRVSLILLISFVLLLTLGALASAHENAEGAKELTIEVMKVHPPFTHFGIAFPVALLVLEIAYLILRRKPDGIEFTFIVLALLGVLLATLSGYYVYTHIDEESLSKEGLELLESHELLGFILTGVYLVVLGLRIAYSLIKDESKKNIIRWIYLAIILLSVFAGFFQGYLGGELAYGGLV